MIRGVGVHTPATNSNLLLSALSSLGVESVRDEITWDGVEQSIGVYTNPPYFNSRLDLMRSMGNQNVTILCYGNAARGIGQPYTQPEREQFVEYVRWILPYFVGIAKYIEIWNEWNGGNGQSAAQTASGQHSGIPEYVALCAAVAPVIREIMPDAVILGGVTAGIARVYQEDLVTAGLMAHVDGMSCHPYLNNTPEQFADNLDVTQDGLASRNGNVEVPMYLTEMGWPTHTGANSYAASTVASYLARAYRYCEVRPFIKGMWWYDLVDDGTDQANDQHRYGLLASDAITPKPAYHAYRAFIRRANRNEENGWCRVAVTAAIESEINAKTSPTNIKKSLDRLVSTGTTTVINAVTYNVMTGPINLSALDEIGERWGDSFHVTEGPVVKGVTPAQTTATRTTTWPSGWK